MNLRADAPDAPPSGVLKKSSDQASANAFASPLGRSKQCNDVHSLAAEFGAPFVRRIRIPAQHTIALSYHNQAEVCGIHDVLEDTAGIFRSPFGADVCQKFACKRA